MLGPKSAHPFLSDLAWSIQPNTSTFQASFLIVLMQSTSSSLWALLPGTAQPGNSSTRKALKPAQDAHAQLAESTLKQENTSNIIKNTTILPLTARMLQRV